MKHSRSSLFLMELIIAILFFSLASAVCMQFFAKAHTLSQLSINENRAVNEAANLAELFLACNADIDLIAAQLSDTPALAELEQYSVASEDDFGAIEDELTVGETVFADVEGLRDATLDPADDTHGTADDFPADNTGGTENTSSADVAGDSRNGSQDTSFALAYDKDWNPVELSEAAFVSSMLVRYDDPTLPFAQISVIDLRSGDIFVSLNVPCHIPERRGSLVK